MSTLRAASAHERAARRLGVDRARLPDDLTALTGGGIAVFLLVFWAVDNGGFDPSTWYWGALVLLAALGALLGVRRRALAALPRACTVALVLFALYVGWSYLSMSWAEYAGFALEGSDRALLYLLLFAFMAVLPWRTATATIVLGAFAVGIGVIAIAFLLRFAIGDNIPGLFIQGRLSAPTGYFNSTAALFTIGALVAVALAARRDLPGVLRGLLVAFASAEIMLAVTVQSRGWLFTLPIVGLWSVVVVSERLRGIAAAIPAAAGALVAIRPMLRLFQITHDAALTHAAEHAGKVGLLACAGVFAVATLLAWTERARDRPPLPAVARRTLGSLAVLLALAGMLAGLWVVSSGHPRSFISRQWNGFTHEPTQNSTTSHFDTVGSGRYDIWRSALEAFRAHPIGGLGQDNFGDWYLTHRHTYEEPLWTHSLWLRLLAHTGIVGFLLFVGFLVAAMIAAVGTRRRSEPIGRLLAGAALLPLGVWLIHGSIDWFWEIPALSGPALGFLAVAASLRAHELAAAEPASSPGPAPGRGRRLVPALLATLAGGLVLCAATVVLGLPYLASHELSLGERASYTSPSGSLSDFHTAHQLDPLITDPGELGGTVALVNDEPRTARGWFEQAIRLRPQDWYAWLGAGLAESSLGDRAAARRDFERAYHINSLEVGVQEALSRVDSRHPLTIDQALSQVTLVQ